MVEAVLLRGRGRVELAAAVRLAGGAWCLCAFLQVMLYFRPTPLGVAYVAHWDRYFFHALYFEVLGVALVSAPFFAYWLLRYEQPIGARRKRVHLLHGALLAVAIFLNAADHETMRFFGTHADLSWLRTYLTPRAAPASGSVMSAISGDPGGPWLALLLPFGSALALLVWLPRLVSGAAGFRLARGTAAALVFGTTLGMLSSYPQPGHVNRRRRVEPQVTRLARDGWKRVTLPSRAVDTGELGRRHQERWLAESGDPGWTFPDPERPYLRAPVAGTATTPVGPPWNVIFIQLECVRGWDVGLLNGHTDSATPFLDALSLDPKSAWWTRAMSHGPPTLNGFFSAHCGTPPHSTRHVCTEFTQVDFECFPETLRRHGYTTELMSASDPDWDNRRHWLLRWYDRYSFPREAKENDRIVFHRAADRVREIAAAGRPFLFSLISISNHFPYRVPEPAFDRGGDQPGERIRDTTRFTDDVLREFVASIAREPWFERTLLVVTSDHGFNLGEHGRTAGGTGSMREATWIPLVIHGGHPRLVAGRHDEPAGLIDLAPTIADLLDIRDPNPWAGRSLARATSGTLTGARFGLVFAESPRWSFAFEADWERPRLFAPLVDPRQDHDLGASDSDAARDLLTRAEEARLLNDALIEADRVWDPGRADAGARTRR